MTNIIFMTIILKNWLLKMALHFSDFEIHSVALCGCVCCGVLVNPVCYVDKMSPKIHFWWGNKSINHPKLSFFLHLYPVMCRAI